jgi:hypothetical protein
MGDDARAELVRELKAEPPAQAVIAKLSDEDAARLLTLFRQARQRQDQSLLAAQEQALRFVPAPMRGPVRRVLLG